MNNKQKHKINYKASGVNIEKADKLIDSIKTKHKKDNKNILSGIGGFSSLYKIDKKIKDPVIVSGTDGVGTKLKIANKLNIHKHIGQDLVAMCVNDVITSGAQPLFFLDYLATSKIDLSIHKAVLKSITKACEDCEMTLIGGETAEMPGMYNNKEYDLAGFCVGIVSEKKIINNKKVKEGDLILGIKSNGFHSNGYSLINKLIEKGRLKLKDSLNNTKISSLLIKPTRLYVNIIKELMKKIEINALAHITGGGITDNVPRVIPDELAACINLQSLKIPKSFRYIQELSKINDEEMLKTFNCGIGMVVIINKKYLSKAHNLLNINKEKYKVLGQIIKKPENSKIIYVD
jgi:phosphoribosylformylglycinamidine cyclo-ligase